MQRQPPMFIGLFLLLIAIVFAQEPASVKLPDTPAARIVEAYIKAFNSGQLTAIQEFHAKHDARPNPLDANDAEAKDKLRTLMQLMGELKVHRIVESQPLSLRALLTTSKGQWLAVSCEAKEDAPDKMTVFRLERIPTPTEAK